MSWEYFTLNGFIGDKVRTVYIVQSVLDSFVENFSFYTIGIFLEVGGVSQGELVRILGF